MNTAFVPSTIRRLFAFGIDQIVMVFFYMPFAFLFYKLFLTDSELNVSLGTLFLLFMVPAFYEFVFLYLFQATPGKMLFSLKVVPAQDWQKELHVHQCVLRALAGRLTFFFSWALYAVAFFRYDRTHVADWIAETRVVQGSARLRPARVRWFVGMVLVCMNFFEGLSYSRFVIGQIDWGNRTANLRTIIDPVNLQDFNLEDFDDEEDEDLDDAI